MTKNARSMYHCRWSFCGEETSWRCRLTTWRMAGSAPVRSCGSANSGWLTWLTRGCTVPACCHSLFSCRKSSSTNTLRCHLQYSLHQHLLLCIGASGCVVESQICNLEVAGSNLGQGYFAPRSTQPSIPPRVGKWVPAIAKAGMAHSDCGWTFEYAGKTVKSRENTYHTWMLLLWWFTTKRRYIKYMHLYLINRYSLHCALSLVAQCIVIGPVCSCVCLFVCGSVTMITQKCVCIDLHQTGSVGEGSDHLQLIKFWPSCTPGRGSVAGWKFLAPPYYSKRTVFASPLSTFSLL